MKKVLSLVLVLVMLCSSFAGLQITSHAANLPSSGSCGDGVTFTFDSATGLLTISGNGAMRADAFEKYSVHFIAEIKTVVINNGVTSIGYSAFKGCSGLTSVTIGNSVTSINDHAFSGCSSLTSIIIPNSVTSIGGLAFRGCSGLTSVSIGNSVTSIGSFAFEDCSGLTSITIPDSVTSIEWSAFCDCSGLTGITIPNSVTSIGDDAFSGCSGLTSVSIGNSVTSIGNFAFYGCSGLTGITVDSGNTQYDSRGNCNAIIKTSTNTLVTGCKNTVIPNTVTSIGNNAFHGCSGLTSITIPDSVTSIGSYAFSGCSGLTGITIPNSVTSIGSSAFRGCSGLTGITIPDSVTSIGDYAFRDCSGLTSVTIGNSVTSIGDSAFDGCHGLTSVNISSIGAWCNISFISYDSNPLYYAHNLYLNNELITDLAIPNSVTSIGNNAFYGCSGLTSITIPNSVTSIGRSAFSGCNSLKDVYYSGSESEWNEIDIGEYNGYLLAAILHLNTKPVHTHEYVGVITTPATCTEAGVKTFTCTCGETYTEQVAALGHDYGSWALTKAPTCTEKGEETRVCNRDISHKEVRDISALGHKFAAGEQYCQNGCGSINPDYIPPHTHSYTSAITTQATCTQAGVKTFTCTCGEAYTEPVAALGHAFGAWQQTKAPTCTAKGEETRVCNRDISHKEVRDIAALGHNSDVEKSVTSGATQLGYTEHRCSRCDELQNVDSYTAPTGKLTLKNSARTANAIKVQWNNVKSATGYQVQISSKDGKKWDKTNTLKAGVTSYTFKKLAAGKNYKFRVRFFIEAADGKDYYSPWSATLNSPTLPTGTTLTKLTAAKKAFNAQWKKNASVNGYQVQYGVKSNFSGAKTLTVKNAKTLKAAVKKLSAKKTYYVRIRTYKTISKVNYFSTWSKAYKVKTK